MTPLEEIRHSCSHVLATALLRVFPDVKLDIGPPTDTGFYYDIDLDHKLTQEDLTKLEAEMKKIAEENQAFTRKEVSREEATEIIKKMWDYIKAKGLQDKVNKRNINADENLKKVFGGKAVVNMFEMTKLVSKHLS